MDSREKQPNNPFLADGFASLGLAHRR